MRVTSEIRHRAAGVLLAQACGDALGVPYEFAAPPHGEPRMIGGGLGPYAPGEWSDDTQMAICIARVAANGDDLRSEDALDAVAQGFLGWLGSGASDVGIQTRSVLRAATAGSGRPAERMRAAARRHFEKTGRAAGNGALMRTGIVALSALNDRDAAAAAARAVAELTHADPLAGDSCVLWGEAIRVAVVEGRLDVAGGLDLLPSDRRDRWAGALTQAQENLQAAWAAIHSTRSDGEDADHLRRGLETAISIGHDTDTIAAIAGQLLGARYGASAVPATWRRLVHGWPDLRARDLVALALDTANGGPQSSPPRMNYRYDRMPATRHPLDEGVLLGSYADLTERARLGFDAVISLCRIGHGDLVDAGLPPQDHLEVWLVDSDDARDNPHLEAVLRDTLDAIEAFRAEGKTVLVHCVAGHNRTPAIARAYANRRFAADAEPAASVLSGLPVPQRRGALWDAACASPGRD